MVKEKNWIFILLTVLIVIFIVVYGKNTREQAYHSLPILGDFNAPLLIEVYSDYQCPFAARYYIKDIRSIIKDYVDTGKARLVYRELAFEGKKSEWAAEAARCANDQGKFWEFHDKIFQRRYNTGSTDVCKKDNLKAIAKSLALNMKEFNQCLDSGKYSLIVKKETQKNLDRGINGTPTTFLNGIKMVNKEGDSLGAIPYKDLVQILNEHLLNKHYSNED